MKLTDLRDELNARAETTDETPDLLSGVHRKITQTKRRRTAGAAGAVAGVALIAAFATGLIPGLTTTTPQPAETPTPRDYTKNGMVISAVEGQDTLLKGWVGDLGENKLDFSWTPQERQDLRFEGLCQSGTNEIQHVKVTVNDFVIGTSECFPSYPSDQPGSGVNVQANDTFWLAVTPGKSARVVVQLTDESGRAIQDRSTQVALGIYHSVGTAPDGPPGRIPPTSDADYVKDGVRYRAKVGGDTLLGALVADRGKNQFDLTVTATGSQLSLSPLCTALATGPGEFPLYQLSISYNGGPASSVSCSGGSLDAGAGSSVILGVAPPAAGEQVKVSVRLEDKNGKPVTREHDWIGLGVYAKGKQQTVDDTNFDELREHDGRNYRLTELKKVAFPGANRLTIATPADTPFLVSYGSTGKVGQNSMIEVTGLSNSPGRSGAGGYGTEGEPARPAGTATLTATGIGKGPGHLVMAIYVPAD
ncbi:hypothetical protein GCM10009554_54280 [Kribbella koreensis]|uniref:Uncharacterized protein n=1 Tax=Kribbella koreensis TaxID=57909 RepID=A0ABP4BP06_9ACTN